MAKSSPPRQSELALWWHELRENISVEFVGLIIFLLGGLALVSLLASGNVSNYTLPWLTQMVGWTAPWLALSLIVCGAVLMLGERVGYWSVEAVVGAELLLLAGQMGAFLWNHDAPQWQPQLDGGSGGLVGVTLGSVLLFLVGRGLAALLVMLLAVVGSLLLIKYTPLIYLYWQGLRRLPGADWLTTLQQRQFPTMLPTRTVSPKPPAIASENFVPAADPAPSKVVLTAKTAAPTLVTPVADPHAQREPPSKPATRPAKPKTKAAKQELSPTPAGQVPAIELLNADHQITQTVDVHGLQQLIESTLADFNVPVRTVHVETGPTVTQFGVEPLYTERGGQRRKVRVSKIVNLADDLALAMAVPAVRIEAPVPGRPYVGIEVPNSEKSMVSLRGIMESREMQSGGKLILPLGRNTAGAPVVMDLTRAPHMLIAGATGAGKSVCINTIVTGLLMQHGPDRLRFVMVDPKMVELPGYNGIPHLLGNVITDVEQVMGALTWLLLQMDDRYRLFQQLNVRNIDGYNALLQKRTKGDEALQPLPYIVLIIDELADLMMTSAEDIERQICRLAQMARATGIHLILATQRPSVDVVTGLIKANFPSRIAFAVTSQTDSRVILDTPGAERLLGRGDMLLMRPDMAKLQRIQGCFVAEEEIAHIVSFWKAQNTNQGTATPPPWAGLLDRMEDTDELLQDAIDVVRQLTTINTSQLQRKLRIGYPKAARLMEQLEAKGIIGPDEGNGQGREVLKQAEAEEEMESESAGMEASRN